MNAHWLRQSGLAHKNIVNEIDMLLEYRDHDHVFEKRRMMDMEAKGSKSEFPMYTYMMEKNK